MKNVFETDRLYIREHSLVGIPALHSILSDPETMRFWPAPFSLKDTERWVARAVESYAINGYGRYSVILKSSDELVGDCGFQPWNLLGKEEIDLGYIFHKKVWGKGLAVEAAKACLAYGVKELGLRRVVANMAEDHLASKSVAEKIGMKLEARFLNPRNRNFSTLLYSYSI